jgi:hypothetical protein
MRTHARPIALAALAAFAAGIAAAPRVDAQTPAPIVLDGTIADGTPRYFGVAFAVPEGVREVEVRHDDLSEANILDWGLRDPTRFRGWGGGNTEPAVVSVDAASRSYLPGAIPAGQWTVMIGQARVTERPARYHVEIVLRTAATLAAQPERRAYTHAPALATGPRWWAGDFHVHSRESGDATATLDEIAALARGRGLDFVELSEHNTVSQLDFIVDAQARHPDLLFVPGIEVTTYAGHANAIGATRWVDFTVGSAPTVTIGSITDAVAAQDALFSINHPVLELGDQCIGCAWSLAEAPERVNAIEVQNGQYSVTGALFFNNAIRFWERYLARGLHVAPLGGSDDHRAGQDHGTFASPIGGPTTLVYAPELSVPALIAAVRAGRTVVKLQGPDDPMVELRAGDAMIGDTVRDRRVTLRATVTRGNGATLRFVRNGGTASTVSVTADPFTTTLDVDAPPGTADDRWRCELAVNGPTRVLTGHLWIAATGEAIPPDAGTVDADADAGTGEPRGGAGGCGCRSARPAPPRSSSSLARRLGLALAATAVLLARRRGRYDIRRRAA